MNGMHIAVVDICRPGTNLGWAMDGASPAEGTDIGDCVAALARALQVGPVALGFEAPMFVPCRADGARLTAARQGECGGGFPNRPFSAGAGAAVTVTGLVVVPYILRRLRTAVPEARAWLDWARLPQVAGDLVLFEAFVTNQNKTADTRHVEDARLAIAGFRRGMADGVPMRTAITEPDCLSLLGAMMLRTGWATDPAVLAEPCLVVRG